MLENAAIQAVVFDLDGLMFNTEELYVQVGSEVLRRRGKSVTGELLDAMMGLRPKQAIARMIEWHELDATVEEIEAESRDLFKPLLDHSLRPMTGLMELLRSLESAGMPKAVATSSGRQFVNNVLGRYDLLPRFKLILTSEDVGEGKPDPEIYLTAAVELEVSPDRMVVLEDSQNGCRAGVAAGAQVVAVPGGHSAHHDFSGAELVISSLADKRLYDLLSLG